MRRFLLIFAILFLAPIIGHAATCTSTETVTKCAKIPTTIYGYEYTNGQYTSDSWSLEYNDVVLSGNSATISGFDATCTINSPFNASIDGSLGPEALDFYTAYQACANVGLWEMKTFSFTSKLDGDICPDGFYTVPYNVSCGAGMVDTANVPNCSDDTSGESCLIPAISAPAPEYKFSISAYDTSSFSFKISAAGTFYVDWGDGNTETIEKPDTTNTTYSHNYSTADTYTIKIGGLATAYNSSRTVASISFEDNMDIESIDGSLGAIFPTLSDGGQPSFYKTFFACYSLADIPETLFSGVTGNAPYMFGYTFTACEGLTSIPENLFSGITGAAEGMFASTFMGCAGITNIPEKLFAGVTGSAPDLFNGTFDSCFSLTSIPENLFSGITGVADGMFEYTFQACNMLTGPSARINGKYLYELWPDNIAEWGNSMYFDSTGLDDYACIPTVMGGGGETCLMPATCTSTETVTKCAKISTIYEKIDYEVLSDTEYIIYFRSTGYGYTVPVHGIATETACTLTTAPFEKSNTLPPVVPGETAAKSCAEGSFFAINNLTASETDICPDGFFPCRMTFPVAPAWLIRPMCRIAAMIHLANHV